MFRKIDPAGRWAFMVSYRALNGKRRKLALGTYGQITVDQARKLSRNFFASGRGVTHLSPAEQVARLAPTVKGVADRFKVEQPGHQLRLQLACGQFAPWTPSLKS